MGRVIETLGDRVAKVAMIEVSRECGMEKDFCALSDPFPNI